ncbi:MAG: protein translocase subunit SecF [Clostridia bacterium]|nr:protein translocase subunit SecF [Clostridia bacterium]
MNLTFVSKNHAKTCAIVSASIVVLALLLAVFGIGLNLGIDFTGGILLHYEMNEPFSTDVVRDALAELGINGPQIAMAGPERTELQTRFQDVENPDGIRAALEEKLRETYPQIAFVSIGRVGAVAGNDLVRSAALSVAVAWLLILIYIAIRFDLYSGLSVVFGILHDVGIVLAFMVFLRGFVQINSTFIAALLTIVGYSINNAIVIFDRIRENNGKNSLAHLNREQIVSHSVQESLTRTINTTLTTLVAVVMLYILGVDSIREFTLPLIIGMLSDVYCSNKITGYVWVFLLNKRDQARLRAKKA